MPSGLRRSVSLDGPVAQFVAGLDGNHPVGERINQLAELSGADVEQVRMESLPVIRTLLWQGLVLPSHDTH